MPRNMPRKQAGFTLVEIAIVLVIIGLLLGGVLKGQELIQSAKVKNVVNDFSSVTAAIYGYQDRYKALPGDDTGTGRWTGLATPITAGNGDGVINGGTGTACAFTDPTATTSGVDECFLIWSDLRQAGFITGALNSGPPLNAYNGQLGVQDGIGAFQSGSATNNTPGTMAAGGTAGTGFKGPVICESNIPDKGAIAIDNQLDDGNPSTGSIRAVAQAGATGAVTLVAGGAADATYVENGTTYYTICKAM